MPRTIAGATVALLFAGLLVAAGVGLGAGGRFASGSSTATVSYPSDATIEPDGVESAAVTASDVPAPGVCTVTVDITYDPDVQTPTGCQPDPEDQFGTTLCNTDIPGTMSLTLVEVANPVSGEFPVANITWQAVGDPGQCTTVGIIVHQFADCSGLEIPVVEQNGENCIAALAPTPTPTSAVTPTPMPCPDDDGDGLCNDPDPCPNDDDCDDDGLMDGSASSEDLDDDGMVDPGETDPENWDTDGDGLSDGLEKGLTAPEGNDTDTTSPHWQPDADPSTRTDPLSADTNGDTIPDGQEDTNANGAVDPGESDPAAVAASLAQGWSQTCYAGEEKPTEEALGEAAREILAVYRLGQGQIFDRWFPGRPEVSTIVTIGPWDQLFVLVSEAVAWSQQFSGASHASVTLAQGWNSVCYGGTTKDMETAIGAISEQVGVVYALQADQTWERFVPDRPDVSDTTQAARLDALLVLVVEEGGTTWIFAP